MDEFSWASDKSFLIKQAKFFRFQTTNGVGVFCRRFSGAAEICRNQHETSETWFFKGIGLGLGVRQPMGTVKVPMSLLICE